MRHFILPRPVAARSRRMFHPATMARLVEPPRRMQRPPARVWPTPGAVDMAPIAMAADERLGATVWVRAQKQPGLRQTIAVATAAPVLRPPKAGTRGVATAFQSRQVYRITLKYTEARPTPGVPSRIAQVAPQGPPAPVASLRAKGAPRRVRVPPMDDLDNPKRRSKGQPSDYTSANNYGFGAASTNGPRKG